MIKLDDDVDLRDFTLIIPSVAVGNVGQLAVDLLVLNLNLRRIGRLINYGLIPVIGSDPYDKNSRDLCTSVDLYANKDKKIVTLQIRSPLIKKHWNNFFDELNNFIKEKSIAKVIILTSSYAYQNTDNELRTIGLRYFSSSTIISEYKQLFDELKWIHYESKIDPCTNELGEIEIPGGGFAKSLFNLLSKKNIKTIILFKFCYEGDNISDSIDLALYLNQWLNVFDTYDNGDIIMKQPMSWSNLYGNAPAQEIY